MPGLWLYLGGITVNNLFCLNCRCEYDPTRLFCPECGSSETLPDAAAEDLDQDYYPDPKDMNDDEYSFWFLGYYPGYD